MIDTSQGANNNTANGKLIYLNGEQKPAEEQPAAVGAEDTDPLKAKMGELSMQERKQLRMARFGAGKGEGIPEAATTLETMQLIEEQKRKKLERAERFGIVTKELSEKRIKER